MSKNNTTISTTKNFSPRFKIHDTRLLLIAETSSWKMADRGLLQKQTQQEKKNLRKKIDRQISTF
jgi:hypothetical protein